MSFAVWLVAAGTGILTGGGAGYLASVYSAGPVARRQASAQGRIAAEREIARVVTDYLGEIRAFELNPQFIYPAEYARIAGRERLAEDVLAQLPALSVNTAARIRELVAELAGRKTMDSADLRIGVPPGARMDPGMQEGQHDVIERTIRLGYHRGVGCKQELYRFCEQEHFPDVRSDYGVLGLLWLMLGHPHSQYRPGVQAEAIALLRAILNLVQLRRVPPEHGRSLIGQALTALGR